MAKTATIKATIEPRLKQEVEKLFKEVGLTTTNVVIPNKTTEKVFKDTDAKKNLIRCEDADDMFDKL